MHFLKHLLYIVIIFLIESWNVFSLLTFFSPISRKNWNVVCNDLLKFKFDFVSLVEWINKMINFIPIILYQIEMNIFYDSHVKVGINHFWHISNFNDTKYFERFCDFVPEFSVTKTDQNKKCKQKIVNLSNFVGNSSILIILKTFPKNG